MSSKMGRHSAQHQDQERIHGSGSAGIMSAPRLPGTNHTPTHD